MATLIVSYWHMARRVRPPFGDAQSPTHYQPENWYAEDRFTYTTERGYRQHVALLKRDLDIIAEQTYPNGATLVIYRDRVSQGPHDAPAAMTIPAFHL